MKEKISIDLLRHMTLNCLRSYRGKYGRKFGELVLVSDGRDNWRKTEFPYYKARRKMRRDDSKLDWSEIYGMMNQIQDELRENFPYKFIQVHRAEADDVIAALCFKYGQYEPILIMSADTDFVQLQTHPNIEQYSPTQKKWIKEPNPVQYLREHIIEGDGDDDVPNMRSVDTSFVHKIKQKPITAKYKEKILAFPGPEECLKYKVIEQDEYEHYKRNIRLIDLRECPKEIHLNILEEYEKQDAAPNGRGKLFNYFIAHRLRNLLPAIQEF